MTAALLLVNARCMLSVLKAPASLVTRIIANTKFKRCYKVDTHGARFSDYKIVLVFLAVAIVRGVLNTPAWIHALLLRTRERIATWINLIDVILLLPFRTYDGGGGLCIVTVGEEHAMGPMPPACQSTYLAIQALWQFKETGLFFLQLISNRSINQRFCAAS